MDARLLAPAGAAWACAAGALLVCSTWPQLTPALIAGALLGTLASFVLTRRLTIRVITLACAFGIVLAGVHAFSRHSEPWQGLVKSHSTVEAQGVVTGDPLTRTTANTPIWMSGTSTSQVVRVEVVRTRGRTMTLRAPVEIRWSEGQSPPAVGSTVVLRVRLSPAPWNRDLGAYGSQVGTLMVVSAPGLVHDVANAMRAGLRDSTQGLSPDTASLITGLAVGDVSQQRPEFDEAMRGAGLAHLTAVSGGNVAIVLAAVLLVTSRLRLRRRTRVIVALGALAFFVLLVRPQPSVIRAAVMCSLVILGMLTGGRRAGPAVLCASVLILIGLEPGLAVSWGFALSVAATAGLIIVSPRLQRILQCARVSRRWPPSLREAVAIAASAQVATLPILVAMGAGLGLLAIPANLLAMPAVAPVTILGLLAAVVAPVWLPGATVLSHCAAPFAWWISRVAVTTSDLPLSHVGWPSGIGGVVMLAVVALVAWRVRAFSRRRWPGGVPATVSIPTISLCCVLIAVLVVYPPSRRGWPPESWVLVMCDVGQGDALVLHDSQDNIVVIDTGPDPALIDSCLADLGVTRIDTVLLTHFHADHVVGLPGILRGRQVRQVLVTSIEEPAEQAAFVQRTLASIGMNAAVARVDQVGSIESIGWRVLWPRRRIESGSVPNNASVVLHVTVESVSLLLTGDIEPEAQAAIIAAEPSLNVDVMKVPHHGSRYQDPRLPAWSHARVALISAGEGNSYGHPSPETVDAWQRVGALVARTDTGGDLAVVSSPRLGLVPRRG
ncbi:MAG: ComEC/Rec2 family competence protein [Actinomycetes bacterium]